MCVHVGNLETAMIDRCAQVPLVRIDQWHAVFPCFLPFGVEEKVNYESPPLELVFFKLSPGPLKSAFSSCFIIEDEDLLITALLPCRDRYSSTRCLSLCDLQPNWSIT